MNLVSEQIDPSVVKFIPYEVAHKYQIFPMSKNGASLTLAMADPSNVFAIDDIKFMTGYNVKPVVASESTIKEAISKYYEQQSDALQSVMDSITDFQDEGMDYIHETEEDFDESALKSAVEEAPVVKLVNLILSEAINRGASDIHLEPYEKSLRVRYRIDGVLYDVMQPPMKMKAALSSRIKIMRFLSNR